MRHGWTFGGKGTRFPRGVHINIGTNWPFIWIGSIGQMIMRAIKRNK